MTKRLLAFAGFCIAIIGANYLYLRADEVQSGKPAPRSKRSALQVQSVRPAPPDMMAAKAVINKYCVTCHNAKLKTAGLMLDGLDVQHVGDHAELWEKVARKFRTGEMPPPGMPRPDKAAYEEVNAQLETALDAASAANPNPGRVAVHRLNRAEYTAAVRDLLGLEVDGRALLSSDDADQEGFDNVASVLSVSPVLLENYLASARTISRQAIGDPTLHPVVDTFKYPKLLFQDDQMSDDLPFGSQGGALIRYHFPLDAEYTIKVQLRREEYDYIVGIGEPHQLDIRLDGVRIKRFTVGGEAKGYTNPESFAGNTQGGPEFEVYMHTADAGLEVRIPVKAGEHEVGVSFVSRHWEQEGILQPPETGFGRTTNEYYHGNPSVEFVLIGGPYGKGAPGDSLSRRKIFVCSPKDAASEEPCARKILSTLATRAYRRPVNEDDVQTLMSFYRAGRADQSFDNGIQQGIERMLAAPSFLFRVERVPGNLPAGSTYRLSDLDLASRLSFFLWSSIPDEDLLNAGIRGKLRDPKILEQQVRRMLRDPRSRALVDGFANRWLELSKLPGVVPDNDLYKEFDENLRDAMAKETQIFIASQMQEDRCVAELLTADYTFVNERLAKHYGIPNIYGDRFRKVTFTDGVRGGLLGQSSILAVTSYPNRTSVTIRGRWMLANLLGSPPPPPPPDVPALKDAGMDGAPRALRERMELHRKNTVCASCHQRMDPLGFALENFDALGKWRTESDGAPIDASASLPDGTRFNGVAGLRTLLGSHKEDFVRTLAGKLMAYAVGRGVEYTDLPAIRKIARDAAQNDYRWSSIVLGIVNSPSFSMGIVGSPREQPASLAQARVPKQEK